MSSGPEWATASGEAWAQRWRETDRALSGLAPSLHQAILERAPKGPFRALDIGCGAGATSLAIAQARADAAITACDLSPALGAVAENRLAGTGSVRVVVGDAEEVAARHAPLDLIFSRHGVMFFADPARAFRTLRSAASAGAALVFSCFQDWSRNPWASELASAAAGRPLPPPGREPSGFAFADTDYVQALLSSAGWAEVRWRSVPFRYVAGAVDEALAFLTEIGPASSVVRSLDEQDRPAAVQRMRAVVECHSVGDCVEFAAAAWIYSARAGGGGA